MRLLIKHNACAPYLTSTSDMDGSDAKGGATSGSSVVGEEEYDPFVKPKDA